MNQGPLLFLLTLSMILVIIWFSRMGNTREHFIGGFGDYQDYYDSLLRKQKSKAFPLKDIIIHGGCISLTNLQSKFKEAPFLTVSFKTTFANLRTGVMAALAKTRAGVGAVDGSIPGPAILLLTYIPGGPNQEITVHLWFPSLAPTGMYPGNYNIGYIGACHRWAWRYISSQTYREAEETPGDYGYPATNKKCFFEYNPIGDSPAPNPEAKGKTEYYSWAWINQAAPALKDFFTAPAAGFRLNIIYTGMKITHGCVLPIVSPSGNYTLTLDKQAGILLLAGGGTSCNGRAVWTINPRPGREYSELSFDTDGKLQLLQGSENVWSTPAPPENLSAPFAIILTDTADLMIVDQKGAGANMNAAMVKAGGFSLQGVGGGAGFGDWGALIDAEEAEKRRAADAKARGLADAEADARAERARQLKFTQQSSEADIYTHVSTSQC